MRMAASNELIYFPVWLLPGRGGGGVDSSDVTYTPTICTICVAKTIDCCATTYTYMENSYDEKPRQEQNKKRRQATPGAKRRKPESCWNVTTLKKTSNVNYPTISPS